MTRKALVIGIPSYPHFRGRGQRQDLKYAPRDAQDIANYLINYGRFEVQFLPEACIDGTYKIGERGIVKAKQLQDAIYNLFVQPKDGKLPQTALLFFAGHGLAITEYGETIGYLGASDNNPETEKWGVPLNWLVKQLVKSPVPEQIIWLDCCHSGKLTREIFEQANPQNQGMEDVSRCFIAACRDTETAHGVDGHGVLTHLLLQGLNPDEYDLGKAITNLELEATVESTFNTHPKFKTYPQRPVFFHCGRAIYFWDGRGNHAQIDSVHDMAKMNIEKLVQRVRKDNYERIQTLHGTMQLLDIAHPVAIDQLYVDVHLLSEPTKYNYLEINDLLQGHNYREDFDRFGLSNRQKRTSGLDTVINYPKLMVLGKPGAGKTTFLQHIAIECNKGNLLADKIPIFIRARDFIKKAEKTGNFSFESYICAYLRGCSLQEVKSLLIRGNFLLLLDGLDEVARETVDILSEKIKELMENYEKINIVISCRIQGNQLNNDCLKYIEIADFNPEQIKVFSEKYFLEITGNVGIGKSKAAQFIKQSELENNKQIRELLTTPILLSLACKIFHDQSKFYSQKHELYERGLELLLSKWDDLRQVRRDNIYRNLNVQEKQYMLGYIAAKKFEQEQYVLFSKDEILGYISDYLDVSLDKSNTILNSIIVQHGLLIERAQGIYSFSHLTFQEYFAAKWFCHKNQIFDLVNHVLKDKYLNKYLNSSRSINHKWREVIFSVLNISNPSKVYEFLLTLKKSIDYLYPNEQFQEILVEINKKALQNKDIDNKVGLRAFYIYLVKDFFCLLSSDEILLLPRIYGANNLGLQLSFIHSLKLISDFNECYHEIVKENISHYITLLTCYSRVEIPAKYYNLESDLFQEDILYLEQKYPLLNDIVDDLDKEFRDNNYRPKVFDLVKIMSELWEDNNNILSPRWWYVRPVPLKENDPIYKEVDQLINSFVYYSNANEFLITCLKHIKTIDNRLKQKIINSLFLPLALVKRLEGE